MEITKKPGIYKITCLSNGIIYIGSSNNIKKRWAKHIRCFRKGDHCNPRMQNCFNKYGENDFIFEVVELVENLENLIVREQHYIDLYNACKYEFGFNMCPVAGSTQGRIVSDQARINLSKALKGRPGKPTTEATKEKQRQAKLKNPTRYWLGKNHSPETKNKISKIQIGRKASEGTKAKMKQKYLENKLNGVCAFKSKQATVVDKNGNIIHITNIAEFCRNNNLSPSCLNRVIIGERKQHKGYTLKPMRKIKQQYIPYWEWEDWINGMWRKIPQEQESEWLNKCIEFTGDWIKYGSAMEEVVKQWPRTMINSLTSPSTNKRAFVGHCAVQYKIQCPEHITRMAWKELTEKQRNDADEIAQIVIDDWIEKYAQQN